MNAAHSRQDFRAEATRGETACREACGVFRQDQRRLLRSKSSATGNRPEKLNDLPCAEVGLTVAAADCLTSLCTVAGVELPYLAAVP
jgi:hypothetical protein